MPTNDPRVFATNWFVNPKQPLIENKVIYAKIDNLLYYITAHRGPTTDDIEASPNEVKSVMLTSDKELPDNEVECFNKLVKALDTPAR